MITLKVVRDPDGLIRGFTMSGHAGSGPHGYDLVCAGASAVSFGALNAVEQLTGIRPQVNLSGEGGFLSCRLPDQAHVGKMGKARLILEAMLVSMRTIEHSYGTYIRIIDKGGTHYVET
ncbi:ribosomal-processing cysteine protease Prp [Sporolactobacillus sp. Y61]|uniref:Ribosomal processing cysteine protease Prp n=1 Tax=Sporolactobacillus sp. Y61 TaxID=3160863 RepID=A0AAU8IEG6_9BACL